MTGDDEPARPDDRVSLDLRSANARVGRLATTLGCSVGIAVLAGVAVGVVTDWPIGLIAAALLGVPLAASAIPDAWLRTWLRDGVLSTRSVGVRSVDLRHPSPVELLVTPLRASRVVRLRVGARGRVSVTLATYTPRAHAELAPTQLRRLADALAGGEETDGLVFGELLVAQLRALARDEPVPARPLYRLAATSGRRRCALRADEVGRFVASLD